jgi:flavin reductase (DIM6/NTAB) family NADH-FMN oxidoreductase RutF
VTQPLENPFADPASERDEVRRFRSRIGGNVSLWTTGSGADRSGLTVSSLMVAQGLPGHVVGLLNPESTLAEALSRGSGLVVQLLEWEDRNLSEAFAGLLPAPGGAFRMAEWAETTWGPRLSTADSWLGARVERVEELGFSLLVDAAIEHLEVGELARPLVHRRGRYVRPDR